LAPTDFFHPAITVVVEAVTADFLYIAFRPATTGPTNTLVRLAITVIVDFVADFIIRDTLLIWTSLIHHAITVGIKVVTTHLLDRGDVIHAICHSTVLAHAVSTSTGALTEGLRQARIAGLLKPAVAITHFIYLAVAIIV